MFYDFDITSIMKLWTTGTALPRIVKEAIGDCPFATVWLSVYPNGPFILTPIVFSPS